jgi:hypothetical protein
VGDQSIASSSSSRLTRGSREGGAVARCDVDELKEGIPNIGVGFEDFEGGGVSTGFEESVREARRSCSPSLGTDVVMGEEFWEEDVAGVLDRVLDRLLR